MQAVKWNDVISATHGVQLQSQDQVDAWEFVITNAVPDIKAGEISKALSEAMERGEEPVRWPTAKDVVRWVMKSRRAWKEESYIEGGWEYFPERERICGQIQRKRAKHGENQ